MWSWIGLYFDLLFHIHIWESVITVIVGSHRIVAALQDWQDTFFLKTVWSRVLYTTAEENLTKFVIELNVIRFSNSLYSWEKLLRGYLYIKGDLEKQIPWSKDCKRFTEESFWGFKITFTSTFKFMMARWIMMVIFAWWSEVMMMIVQNTVLGWAPFRRALFPDLCLNLKWIYAQVKSKFMPHADHMNN